jgi:hypothetical protein
MTHFPTEAFYARIYARTRSVGFHGRCVTVRHLRHQRRRGDG